MSQGKPDRTQTRLAKAMADQLAASMLPGEPPLADRALAEISRFVCAAAAQRDSGKASLVIESVPGAIGERMLRIAAINEDMPFLVDSLAAAVSAQGLTIDRLLHPVVRARRDQDGRLTGISAGSGKGSDLRESIIYIETARADA